jgi:hypothetical protein
MYAEAFTTRSEAMNREHRIKSWKSRSAIKALISARTKSPLIDKAARAGAFCFFWNRISFLLALQFQWPNIYDLFHVFIILSCKS